MKTLTVKDLKEMRREHRDLNVINVLSPNAFERAHIPGSINIPKERDDFVDEVAARVSSKSDPVVVYCASSDCHASPTAGKRLEAAGFTHVFDFEGGIKGWQDAGQPVEQNA